MGENPNGDRLFAPRVLFVIEVGSDRLFFWVSLYSKLQTIERILVRSRLGRTMYSTHPQYYYSFLGQHWARHGYPVSQNRIFLHNTTHP
ncbi:hypothetical protein [Phormidium sp. CCY1219]|uniref:hypothetical protein n=1 Tax=Phormidium sp. CCY1219 TaxID=2886104 RepID=UPI002D1F2893|nr:hypothetical protein [Phormidium sp. CCY1219]MEB3829230.1 hypothetical protein [Phormidium sp. CCY1219]